jgi:hypothetical protein
MIKKFYQEFEQIILFFSLIAYMTTFSIIFDYEMRTTNWMSIIWLVQFFGLSTLLALYSIKKKWIWPTRP